MKVLQGIFNQEGVIVKLENASVMIVDHNKIKIP